MSTYFIIHGSFGNNEEHYLPWLKSKLENDGHYVISPSFPIGKDIQTFTSWSRELDKYREYITKDTIFVGRSIAPIFILKYLKENNLNIKRLYSISGFNGRINVPGAEEYDYVNETFFIDDFENNNSFVPDTVCFVSKNDPFVSYDMLESFARIAKAKVILRENAGHFNTDSGYATFEELYDILKIQQ